MRFESKFLRSREKREDDYTERVWKRSDLEGGRVELGG